ncbi:hypothetical protein ATE84_0957 [Aquimarina sp. MAR_2010_214]|nr:hypothetical protein [Aquimarina sp. MAR_2010_214]PKV48941.1 hypothetical protein ATE84_0957 [Aquimarina sp. MAR_2010_214]
MTEQKLYERLLLHKKKYGVTQETQQHYLWALETLQKSNASQESHLKF